MNGGAENTPDDGSIDPTSFRGKVDTHIHVLLSLEYHGTNYGGWQRQGPNNNVVFPSVQETLEQAATKACLEFAKENEATAPLMPTTDAGKSIAILSESSGRTDRGVHALDHRCVLRVPFSLDILSIKQNSSRQSPLELFLVGESSPNQPTLNSSSSPSPFLAALNQALPPDIHVRTCQAVKSRKQRKQLQFIRKRYTYLIQQAPTVQDDDDNQQQNLLNRPWPQWNDYTYFVKASLDVSKMKQALGYMLGKHDFAPLACEKGKSNCVRTLESGTIATRTGEDLTTLPWFHQAYRRPEARNRKKRKKDSDTSTYSKSNKSKYQKSVDNEGEGKGDSSFSPRTPSEHEEGIDGKNQPDSELVPPPASPSIDDCTISPSVSIFQPPYYGAPQFQRSNDNDGYDGKKPRANVEQNQRRLKPERYTILQVDLEGSGFLRHQVRRMVSVLIKIGSGEWPPEIVRQLLSGEKDPRFLQGQSLAPSRALWKTRVWLSQQCNECGNSESATEE